MERTKHPCSECGGLRQELTGEDEMRCLDCGHFWRFATMTFEADGSDEDAEEGLEAEETGEEEEKLPGSEKR